MQRLLLIDTYNYIHRAYHALPKTFKDLNGQPTNAVYGFTSMLISTLEILKPVYVIAALDDLTQPTFRDADFSQYKANRKEMEEELSSQIPKIEEIITAFGIPKLVVGGYEADDIIGTISAQAEEKGVEVVVVSNDRDILQLLSGSVKVFMPDNSKEGGKFFGIKEFREKYGFEPENLVDYKALRGDASDNIPGVFGIGEKTASSLIQKFETIENMYENLNEIKETSLKEKLKRGKDSAFLSKKIATIVRSTPVSFDPSLSKLKQVDRIKVVEVLKRYNFKSLIRRMGFEEESGGVKKVEIDKSQLSML
ncbi:hypothetical protein A2716_02050 [candidate division WWE3 bacterium RIFCSPHIGHO2_01_FULL_40_23]|uniref:5'-3' exonuclease domain-containing protein n=1 Tax=candidate division WWE3 bacterium RIFCSPLOWO2_01_FULL_41_18 TaxID=1802625 RepID=A0A1F4VET4_UNCKA|nr:MAG: hypothetical protein A2716_02050 [candidate division WWE3 bacterium RIFCSPHIGHO2_01_FULL_40_23]OGC55772.1 MAG: hypothetical protein A3A78_01900 [candidate division WWE3 bacterium RIFCSPLOWO2_01_FULL_41_18]